jgi:hypothetical protein
MIETVVAAGLARRYLDELLAAKEGLGHLLILYEQGEFEGNTIASWRTGVEQAFERARAAADAAEEWVLGLADFPAKDASKGPRRPDLTLLDLYERLDTEQLAAVLGVVVEVARRRRARLEFGPVLKIGRRQYVLSANVKKALGLSPLGPAEELRGEASPQSS